MSHNSTSPAVILMKGHPGTGKSTLAKGLARALRFPLLDKDDVRDCTMTLQHSSALPTSSTLDSRMETVKEPAAMDSGFLSPNVDPAALNSLSYEVLWRMASTQLSLGLSAVIDTPLAREELFRTACLLAADNGAKVFVVECRPKDEQEWRRRLELRAREAMQSYEASQMGETQESDEGCKRSSNQAGMLTWHKPATWTDMQELLAKYKGCWEYDMGSIPHLVLDTTFLGQEEVLETALAWLSPRLASTYI